MNTKKSDAALLDPSYGSAGVAYPHDALISIGSSIQTPRGTLCVGSAQSEQGKSYCLIHLDHSGKLDTQFGSAGITIGRFESEKISAGLGVHICADGRIIISGRTYDSDPGVPPDQALARFTTDGKLDLSFQDKGHLVIKPPAEDEVENFAASDAVAPAEDGVYMIHNYFTHAVVMKFNIDGELDKGFNSVGYKHLRAPNKSSTALARVLTHGRKIYLSGSASEGEVQKACLVCLTDTGQEDQAFNGTGFLVTGGQNLFEFGDMAILDEAGNIVCVAQQKGAGVALINAYTPEGRTLDSFISKPIDFGGRGGTWLNVEVDRKRQRIVTCGSSYGSDDADVLVGRFTINGRPDLEFGELGGWDRIALGKSVELAPALTLQADGKALVGGIDFEESSAGLTSKGFILRCQTEA